MLEFKKKKERKTRDLHNLLTENKIPLTIFRCGPRDTGSGWLFILCIQCIKFPIYYLPSSSHEHLRSDHSNYSIYYEFFFF